ncbi:MAG: response regulator transcription factor [Pseudoxanthomonas sp.]
MTGKKILATSAARIAVVEDDEELCELIVSELTHRGFHVDGFSAAQPLYRHLSVHHCDVVVLDLGLPGENGYIVAAHLRQMARLGIVMLTARGGAADMARGLSHGADLYLVKPLDIEVLTASIRSLLRRLGPVQPAEESTPPVTPIARWSLTANGWSLSLPTGEEFALGEAERAFLQPLFATPGRPVSRETLIGQLTHQPWDFDPHRLEVLVHRLRARVRTTTGQKLPIRAIRGQGYLYADVDSI